MDGFDDDELRAMLRELLPAVITPVSDAEARRAIAGLFARPLARWRAAIAAQRRRGRLLRRRGAAGPRRV